MLFIILHDTLSVFYAQQTAVYSQSQNQAWGDHMKHRVITWGMGDHMKHGGVLLHSARFYDEFWKKNVIVEL